MNNPMWAAGREGLYDLGLWRAKERFGVENLLRRCDIVLVASKQVDRTTHIL